MRLPAFLAILALPTAGVGAQGVPCVSLTPYDTTAYAFTRSVLAGFGKAHRASVASQSANADPVNASEFIYALRKASSEYRCASALLQQYARHPSEDVQDAVQAAHLMYTTHAETTNALLGLYRATLDGRQSLSPGVVADSIASLRLRTDAVSMMPIVMVGSIVAALSVMDPVSDRLIGLALTRAQRDSILSELLAIFGPGVKGEPVDMQSWLLPAGAALYESVSDPAWQLRSERGNGA